MVRRSSHAGEGGAAGLAPSFRGQAINTQKTLRSRVPRRVSIRDRVPRREAGSPAGDRLDDLPDHRGDLLPPRFLIYIGRLDNVNTNLDTFSNDFRKYSKKLIKKYYTTSGIKLKRPEEDDIKELRRRLASRTGTTSRPRPGAFTNTTGNSTRIRYAPCP